MEKMRIPHHPLPKIFLQKRKFSRRGNFSAADPKLTLPKFFSARFFSTWVKDYSGSFFLLLLFFRKEAFGFCTFWGLIWFLLFGSFFEWFFSSTFNIQASIFWLFQLLYEFSIFTWKKLSWIALSVLKFSTLWKLIFLNEEISILFSDWMKIAGFRKGWEI